MVSCDFRSKSQIMDFVNEIVKPLIDVTLNRVVVEYEKNDIITLTLQKEAHQRDLNMNTRLNF